MFIDMKKYKLEDKLNVIRKLKPKAESNLH